MRLFAPLRDRHFAILWVGYSASVAAGALLPTALTLLVLDGQGGVAALGLALAARTAGFLLGALVGGQIADRFPRLGVIGATSAIRAAAVALISLYASDILVALCLCMLVIGVGEGAFRSAYQAIVADLVAAEHRQGANALTTLSARITQTIGPTVAVILHTAVGPGVSFGVAALCWATSAAISLNLGRVLKQTGTGRDAAEPSDLWASTREGLAEACHHRWFIAGLVALLVWLGLGNSVQQLALPTVSRLRLGGDGFMGVALGLYAAGALLGGILLGSLDLRRPGGLAFTGLALYGLVPLALASGSVVFIFLAYFLGGLGIELFNIPWFTAIQREVPKDRLGRVSSIDFLVSYGISPLSLAGMPLLFDSFGLNAVLVATGIAVLSVPILALAVPGALRFAEPRPR